MSSQHCFVHDASTQTSEEGSYNQASRMNYRNIPPRHTPAHSLTDASYKIVADFWQDTQYGSKRSLTLEPEDGLLIHVWLPNACVSPHTSLIGCNMIKRTLPSSLSSPYYGITYLIEFE
jgi:hypothetical protein